jgi:hypothetical protein
MRVGSHIEAAAGGENRRPDVIEEDEGTDEAAFAGR